MSSPLCPGKAELPAPADGRGRDDLVAGPDSPSH